MIQLINKLKKNQKGFTLVELIVVLVILAILAAFTIPAMLGFVNDARGKASIAQAREIYVAAQSAATDQAATKANGILADGTDNAPILDQIDKLIGNDIANVKTNVTISIGKASTPPTLAGKATVDIEVDGTVSKVQLVDQAAKNRVVIKADASGSSAEVEEIKTTE